MGCCVELFHRKAMIYSVKAPQRDEESIWKCNYEGALQSIEMARVVALKSLSL